jgi:predicted nucleic acid-binding protein
VDFFRGVESAPTRALDEALKEQRVVMSSFILAELFSSPRMTSKLEKSLLALPLVEITEDFFIRAAKLRRKVYAKGLGVSMQDAFIAQSCIDAETVLVTRDLDFQTIARHSELKILDFER